MTAKALSRAAQQLGAKGGKSRAESMTPEERARESRRAVFIHWLRLYYKILRDARETLKEFEKEFGVPKKRKT
jgi:hypothetical protein